MKYNYPIKYAIMKVYDQVEWSYGLNELEREYDIVAYIVSKCYLLEETTSYKMNGDAKHEFEVCFPYTARDMNPLKWRRTYPNSRGVVVSQVFDSFDEAKVICNQLNKELLSNKIGNISLSGNYVDKIKSIKNLHTLNLAKYGILEDLIKLETMDMINCDKKDSVVLYSNGEYKILNYSIYSFLNMFFYTPVNAFTISEEDYNKLCDSLKNGIVDYSCLNEDKPLFVSDIESNIVRLYNPSSEVKGSYILSHGLDISYDPDLPRFDKDSDFTFDEKRDVIYTTETFDDIMMSNMTHNDIELDKHSLGLKLNSRK